jgi:hypothetical protein
VILSGDEPGRILGPVKALLVCAILSASAFAANPAIGIVTASGHFTLQGSEVWGNATLFEGASVETALASSELALRNGVKVQLAAGSRARVFADRVTLDRGTGQVAAGMPFEIDAAAFRVQGAGVRVVIGKTIEVAALSGVAKVSGKGDRLLAAIPTGRRMSFAPQDAQTGTVKRSGCLLYKDNHFILQDDNTQEVAEVNNPDLLPNLGNRVEITGTVSTVKPTVSIATTLINVNSVAPLSQGGCLVAASTLQARTDMPPGSAGRGAAGAAAGGAAGAAGGAAGGLSTGAIVGIVAGVGAGGAVAAVALSHGKSSTSQ